MKKIYILHQYLDTSHFKALYDCAEEYGYKVEEYFVADNFYLFKNVIKYWVKHNGTGIPFRNAFKYYWSQHKLKKIKNEILIVGLAPYDSLLFRYKEAIRNNRAYYFSSWQTWDGSDFPRGNIKNKSKWESILKTTFKGAACVSKTTQKGVSQFIEHTCVVNHALPIEEYVKKVNYNLKQKFLFCGRFEDSKNMRYILDWLKDNMCIKCTFDFAGFGSYQKEIEELSEKDKRVKYLGLLDKSEIKKILSDYDFIVLPSKVEPFGISLIESLAAGTPCLASNASGPAEIIEDGYNGIVCDKDSYESYTMAMSRAINISFEDYTMLCKNALVSGKEYSSRIIAQKWCYLFDSLY